jgi:hypothetical protein
MLGDVRVQNVARKNNVPIIYNELTWLTARDSGLENRDYGRRDRRADHATPLYPLKLALTSSTSAGLLVGIVGSRNKVTESRHISILASIAVGPNKVVVLERGIIRGRDTLTWAVI